MSYYFSIRREVERIKPIVDFIRDTLNYSEKEKAINILDLIKKLDIKIKYDKEITRPIFIVVGKKSYIKVKKHEQLFDKKWKSALVRFSLYSLWVAQGGEYPIPSNISYLITQAGRELLIPSYSFLHDIKEITKEQRKLYPENIYWLSIKYQVSEKDIYNKGYRMGVFKTMFDS